jgi:anti-sigma regulatory factor (Ser/Thr protein kinase)/ketosteroid isomerase-like protein
VVAACFAAFGARDRDRFLELVGEDVRWCPANTLLAPETATRSQYEGHDGIREWFDDVVAWEGYSVEILSFEELGGTVFVPAVATLAADDVWLTRAVFFVFTVQEGKVADLRTWDREDEARAAAGLPPVRAALAEDASDTGTLEVPADPSELGNVRGVLRAEASGAGLDAVGVNDLLVAVTEAVTNAIAHGKPHADGTIRLRWGRERDVLAVCVEDRGHFRGSSGGDREEHGRGIAVMRLLVDDLSIEAAAGSTVVRLAKRLPGS